jgi:hypothetical protein
VVGLYNPITRLSPLSAWSFEVYKPFFSFIPDKPRR